MIGGRHSASLGMCDGRNASAKHYPHARQPPLQREDPKGHGLPSTCGRWQKAVSHAWGRCWFWCSTRQSKCGETRGVHEKGFSAASQDAPSPSRGSKVPQGGLLTTNRVVGPRFTACEKTASLLSLLRRSAPVANLSESHTHPPSLLGR